jgi:hypothetical protein
MKRPGILLLFVVVPLVGTPSPALPFVPVTTFKVNAVTPAPGDTVTVAPTEIVIALSDTAAGISVNAGTIKLVRDGPDDAFGTPDDVVVVPSAITVAGGNEIHIGLSGVPLANDTYRVTVLGNTPISSGRVGWWKFDETSGSAASDSSGNGNHGTLGGNPQWQPAGGRVGGALNFDGNGDFVIVPRTASLEPLGSMSVALWVNLPTASGGFADIVRKADANQGGYLVRWHHFDDTLWWRLDRYSNPQIFVPDTQTTAPHLNAWHHIAGTYDAATGTSSLYVDGVLKNSMTGFTGNLEHTDDLFFMWSDHPGQVAIPGLLDDVRIYSRALTATEVQSLAAAISDEGVVDLNGIPIDGEYVGAFPTGDGTAGGDFVSTFTLNTNVPVAPSLLVASPGGAGTVGLSWTDNSGNELGFRIERSADGLSFAEIGTVGPDVASFQDSLPLQTGFYRVRAYNAAGASGYSNPAGAAFSGAAGTTSITVRGGCGLSGLEILLPLVLLAWRRRRRGPLLAEFAPLC